MVGTTQASTLGFLPPWSSFTLGSPRRSRRHLLSHKSHHITSLPRTLQAKFCIFKAQAPHQVSRPASSGPCLPLTQAHSTPQGPWDQLQWYLPSAPGWHLIPTFSAPWQDSSLCSPHTCTLLADAHNVAFRTKVPPESGLQSRHNPTFCSSHLSLPSSLPGQSRALTSLK